ncbi:MAG: GIDE domain-containing protein [Pseudomonadota bacterium]|nr:GIDE domain-containing protein [Pseudomonadota bacterium]
MAFFLQAVLLGLAFEADSQPVWLGAFSAAALINLWAWIVALGWRRAIADTPTSRIASAAQGFVELIGAGQPLPDTQLLSRFTQLPCLWYRYTLERRENDEWRQVEQGESDLPFILEDDSGRCELDPAGAQILTTHQETRTQGDERHTEYVLLKGDRLYALGEFVSFNGAQTALDTRKDVGDLLAEWKADQSELHDRFDLDRSGAIDEKEWQLARQAAEREVARRHQAIRKQPTQHRLQKPGSRKPYLIANHPPEKLGRRYTWLGAAYLVLLLACLFGIGWAMRLPG